MSKRNHFSILAFLCVVTQIANEITGFLLASNDNWALSSRNSKHNKLNANLITFDLDDTIFPVSPVVADANKALFRHLKDLGCDTTQDEYLKTTKSIRNELSRENKVITYTELRKRAIRTELNKFLQEEDVSDSVVFGSYDLWEDHRHMAAETHLYPDTVSMLKQLKSNHPDAIIGAITNGKGNPLEMNSVRHYFDFCVSGEDDNVFPLRKPSEGIYKVALERFKELSEERRGETINMDDQCWIHIGDDLANDVGASAKCGAKAIWVDLEEEYNQSASGRNPSKPQPAWSTATKEELEKRIIMNEKAQKYVSERVTTLEMIPLAVESITKSALQMS
mmetsp:Transcript_21889/g.46018  ORF Transcript_21889/g.46018 Transcript_21889/m.46018 type:complete len:336 (-) Transcript_21889:226-1233(-)